MNFTQFNLDPRLQAGINRLGYREATPIQEAAIPAAVTGQDLIGTAQTGTGKTAAFVLPILNRLMHGPRHRTRALIITPTRELAEQIHESIRDLAYGTQLRSATVYGGVGPAGQIRALREGVEIVVACPGRLLDLAEQGHVKFGNVEVLVLDEADRMFDMGFLPSVKRVLKLVPAKRQTMLFSATFPKEVDQLAAQALQDPKRVTLGLREPVHTVSHALYPVPQHLKTSLLLELLKRTDTASVLIFTRTRHRAQRLSRQIGQVGYKVTSLHSDRTQGQRQIAINGFKKGTYQIMVATDIAARGLDIEHISHVINYDMPNTSDDYIHRIGRTGRAEHTGDAFTLVTPEDTDMVRTLERLMKKPIKRQMLSDFDYKAPPVANPKPSANDSRANQPANQPARRPASKQHRQIGRGPQGYRR